MAVATFSGIASGIDTKSLIAAALEAQKQLKITPKEEEKTTVSEETDAIKEIKTKVEDFRLSLQQFSTLKGGGLSKKAASTDEATISAEATNSAANGTYSLTVNQLATTGTFSFNSRYSSDTALAASGISNAAPAANRTITFTVGTGTSQKTVNVVVTNTSTVADIINTFNATATNAKASVVNVGSAATPSYAITINSTEPGTENGAIGITLGSAFTTNLNAYTLTQAKDAQFAISGIAGTITRSSNKVTDIITGVALQLEGIGSSTISVGADSDTTASKLKELVSQYNGIATYIKENDLIRIEETGSDVTPVYGALARSNVDDDILSTLRNAISAAQASNGTTVKIFSDIGITTERDGLLKFNEDTFKQAVAKDPNGLEKLLTSFADTNSITGGALHQYTQFQGVFDNAVDTNDTEIRDLNERIANAESLLSRLEQSLTARYARLEVTIGKMQGQQSSLMSALGGSK